MVRVINQITCSDCGKQDTIPFVPVEGRPVYCRACYDKHREY